MRRRGVEEEPGVKRLEHGEHPAVVIGVVVRDDYQVEPVDPAGLQERDHPVRRRAGVHQRGLPFGRLDQGGVALPDVEELDRQPARTDRGRGIGRRGLAERSGRTAPPRRD